MGVAKSMTLRGGGGGPTLSVTMTLIFPKIVWTCPLKLILFLWYGSKYSVLFTVEEDVANTYI